MVFCEEKDTKKCKRCRIDGCDKKPENKARQKASKTLEAIKAEYEWAIAHHKTFNSAHEGYAIIKEEFDELWEEIRKKDAVRSKAAMAEEAIHTSAMLLRFLVEICVDKIPNSCTICGKEFKADDTILPGNTCLDCLPF